MGSSAGAYGVRLNRLAAAGLVGLSLVLKLWAMRQWSWFQDDWSYVESVPDLPFLEYVLQDYNGHFMPLQFVAVWTITAIAPLDYTWALVVLMGLVAGGMVAWWIFLDRLFGPRPQVLIALVVIGFAPLLIQPTLWWASGLQTYGLILAMGLVLLLAMNYLQRGAPWRLALLVLTYALVLLAWQKNLLILIPLGFVVFALPGIRPIGVHGRSTRLAGGITAVTVVYLGVFAFFTREPVPGDASLGLPALEPLMGFVVTAGLTIVLPSLLGGTWAPVETLQGAFPMAPTWVQWAIGAATVGLIVISLSVRRRAAWAVLMVLAYALAAWILVVGSSRFDSLGQFASLDARYSADIIPVAALAIVYLTTSTRQERIAGGALRVDVPPPIATAARLLAAGLAVMITMSALLTWSVQMDALGKVSPRPWVDGLLASARAVAPASVFNSNAPDNVVSPAFLPEDARLGRMLAPLRLPLAFDAPGEPVLVANDEGRLVPGEVQGQAVSLPGPAGQCGYVVNGRQWTFIPLDTSLYAWNWGVEIAMFNQDALELEARAPDDGFTYVVPSGVHDVQGVLVSTVDTLALRAVGAGTACVTSVTVGLMEPAP